MVAPMKNVALALWLAAAVAAGCDRGAAKGTAQSGQPVMAGSLQIEDLKIGGGAVAMKGKLLAVHYTGTLADGKKFDSSLDRGEPIQFKLGAGNVIPGWEQGIEGMRVGGKRKLTIPPAMAYGAEGKGPVPPNATLVFDVELVSVQ
jgi:FKBP-type peptidyl-prolyl cis-trans isomerase